MTDDPRMQALDIMKQLLELVTAYRATCEEAGFSPTAAEAMAMDFHRHAIASSFGKS